MRTPAAGMNRGLIIAFLFASVCRAQWSTDPANNLIVGYGLLPEIASDSAGGCYVTYEQNLSYPRQLMLERLDRYGYKPWGTGRRILGPLPEQSFAKITPDGFGGVIVAYHDIRIEGSPHLPLITERLRAQRVDSSGNFLWGATGVRVSVSETSHGDQMVVSDGAGGCIVAWVETDTLSYQYQLRINRIDSAGTRVWGDSGKFVWNYGFQAPGRPLIAADNRHGCYLVFMGFSLQRYDPQGDPYWSDPLRVPTGGRLLMVDDAASVLLFGGKSLGYRNGQALFTINLQKVDTTGALLWDSLGVSLDTICTNLFLNYGLSVQSGYSTVTWPQITGTVWDLRTQVVRSNGSTVFPLGGIAMSRTPSEKGIVGVLPSDSMTSVFVWADSRNPDGMYAQRLDMSGQPLWDTTDVVLNIPMFSEMGVTTDGAGGCLGVGFHQFDFSVRALQVNKHGNLGVVIASVQGIEPHDSPGQPVLCHNYPNPFNPWTTLSFRLVEDSRVTIRVYSVLGRQVAELTSREEMEDGHNEVRFSAEGLSSGVYFYRIDAQGLAAGGRRSVLTGRMLLLK